MTYQEEYTSLIEHAKSTTPQHKGYGIERHHIVPRCMGGTDDESNLVFLTYEQHINAHILLWKANPTNGKLAGAVCSMLDLTGTTAKSASARVMFLESLSCKEMDAFISEATKARSEKNLPWNSSTFPKSISGKLHHLFADEIRGVVECSYTKIGFSRSNKEVVTVALNDNVDIMYLLGGNVSPNLVRRHLPNNTRYISNDIISKTKDYGRGIITNDIIHTIIKCLHNKNYKGDIPPSDIIDGLYELFVMKNPQHIAMILKVAPLALGGKGETKATTKNLREYRRLAKLLGMLVNGFYDGLRDCGVPITIKYRYDSVICDLLSGNVVGCKTNRYYAAKTKELQNSETANDYIKANKKILAIINSIGEP